MILLHRQSTLESVSLHKNQFNKSTLESVQSVYIKTSQAVYIRISPISLWSQSIESMLECPVSLHQNQSNHSRLQSLQSVYVRVSPISICQSQLNVCQIQSNLFMSQVNKYIHQNHPISLSRSPSNQFKLELVQPVQSVSPISLQEKTAPGCMLYQQLESSRTTCTEYLIYRTYNGD